MTYEDLKTSDPGLIQIEQWVRSADRRAISEEIIWFDLWAEIKPRLQTAIRANDPETKSKKVHCVRMHFSMMVKNMI